MNQVEPIKIHYITDKLRFKIPITLTPNVNKDFLFVELPELTLSVVAHTRDALIREINDELELMWNEYVKVDSSALTNYARQLRLTLLNKLEEINNE